ncbi:hypothetical protein HMPREF1143_1983 [Peptoanaerobacter stomatis]|uniref:Uncharacterized protein n=1 Tax=Peptoanaerobacter stomatis TaxID=796937 RepID=J5WDQ9_9FIRM|nr:hypothetical protein [Peptoanaerobacter stomatis]EJU21187.1 hypothetical protein HMPREF1143_1983 [Peptoanaerobacter stomatis]
MKIVTKDFIKNIERLKLWQKEVKITTKDKDILLCRLDGFTDKNNDPSERDVLTTTKNNNYIEVFLDEIERIEILD